MTRTLITTADERTWPKDTNEPVLFLGEWCRRYSRRHVWGKYDAEVAPYHWDDRKKLFNDYQYITGVYEHFLRQLAKKLNRVHEVNYSLRYWRILIGPWLGYFIQMAFDRWYMLSNVLASGDACKIYILGSEWSDLIPNDMSGFNKMYVRDDWNEAIYSQILTILCYKGLDVVTVADDKSIKENTETNRNVRSLVRPFLEKILLGYSALVSKNSSSFFISSYLPLKTDLKLQLKLGQLPTIWRSQSCPKAKASIVKRDEMGWGDFDVHDEFSEVVAKLIPKHLPTAYLEGYEDLRMYPDKSGWPSSPKVIFTSNAYSSDDIFKQWAAEKTESNIPLVIGQHGGHFGMNPFAFHEEHQIDVADRWLSWGWTDPKRPQITKMGNLKGMGRDVSHDPNGNALMVEMTMPRQSYHLYAVTISRQWLDYFNEQKQFVDALPESISRQVQIRLFPNDYGWDQLERWMGAGYEENLEPGKENIRKLISKCRIFISTYNATTHLESLTWNVPTIMFWNPDHWELNAEALPYFDRLKAAGIFHETPQSAAEQMKKVWDDVDGWWNSEDVQTARKEFCDQFVYMSENPVEKLASLFNQVAQQKN